ncbi:hypothetical protein ACSVDA_05525 [Cytobacillus sp. Hm23]
MSNLIGKGKIKQPCNDKFTMYYSNKPFKGITRAVTVTNQSKCKMIVEVYSEVNDNPESIPLPNNGQGVTVERRGLNLVRVKCCKTKSEKECVGTYEIRKA